LPHHPGATVRYCITPPSHTYSYHTLPLYHYHSAEINAEFTNVATWYHANNMAVNMDKTKYMIFHPKGKNVPNNIEIVYNNNDQLVVQILANLHASEIVFSQNPNLSSRSYNCWAYT
jgi:hypothetical protein